MHLLSRLLNLLHLSINLHSLPLTQQAHALSLIANRTDNPILTSKLISSYSHFNLPLLSRQIFDFYTLGNSPNVFLWNSLLSSYCNNGLFVQPISLFNRMRRTQVRPDNYTLAIVSKAAAEVGDYWTGGICTHCLAIKLGFCCDAVLSNCIMRFYSKCGSLDDARKLFAEMPVRSVASWNAMISEYVNLERGEKEVWKLVGEMQAEGMKPDAFTICAVLPLCQGGLRGREIHCYGIKQSLHSGLHVGSCLVSMYSRAKKVVVARRVFDKMVFKNVVIWTAMINGYVENGEFEEALGLFRMMQLQDGILPNKVSLVNVLPAIGSLARLAEGKQVHAFSIRMEFNSETSLSNALIDMYAKCGLLDSTKCVFDDESWSKDVISWSSMISCYGIHGKGKEAVDLFNRACSLGVKMDHIISVGILSACGRTGLVSEGLEIYGSLVKKHGVVPTSEICSCMVDMLGRAGRLSDALDVITSIPYASGSSVWGALLDSSLVHNNREMQDLAYRTLLQLEPENPSNYISFSNSHASFGRWDIVAEVRKRMKDEGLKKLPGRSLININSGVHSFFVADKSHHCSDMIYAMLDNLLLAMKGDGYTRDIDNFAESFSIG